MDVLLIDNNDSFTRNLEHLLAVSIDDCTVRVRPYSMQPELDLTRPDLIVISPGPGTPAEYPGYDRVLASGTPVLGICLGMQIINELRGGSTGRLAGCVHGKSDPIELDGTPHVVARYHSLHVTKVGDGLDVLGRNNDGVLMCLGDRAHKLLGYQFHPESFMTRDGGVFIDFALDYLDLG